jgi:predicted phosphodiesterase
MTKITYMSDIHLEVRFIDKMLPEGDILILAGDITVLRCLNPRSNDSENRKTRDRSLKFFEMASENFKKVIYLTGNHESYNFNIDRETEYIAKYIPNVIHLNNSHVDLGDVVVIGGTLWTDMNKDCLRAHICVGNGMNDFRLIACNSGMFNTYHAAKRFSDTKEYLTKALEEFKDKKVVVATHHAPSIKGVNPEHVRSGDLNYGYYSDLEQFILDRPQIKKWIYGHTHKQGKNMIGDAELLSNARGYAGYEQCAKTFDANTFFDI